MDGCLLWARASIVGGLAFTFGVVGHITANGLLPGRALLIALLTMTVLLSVPMLARPAGRMRIVVLLVGGQAATHLFLTMTAGHVGDPVSAAGSRPTLPTGPQLPIVDGHRVGSLFDAYRGTVDPPPHTTPVLPIGHLVNDLSAHAPMMVVHLVAAALVGLWLAHGERCLWTLIALTGRRIVLAIVHVVPFDPPAPRLARVVDRAPVIHRRPWHVSPHSRRGPPLLAIV